MNEKREIRVNTSLHLHLVKSVQIRTRRNSVFGHFSRSITYLKHLQAIDPSFVSIIKPLSNELGESFV